MTELHTLECEACHVGAPRVEARELPELLSQVPTWDIATRDGVDRLEREFAFADFAGALAFTNEVGDLAERFGHHPQITLTWGRVQVSWWSHKIKGLHKSDFIMAAKTDRLIDE